MKRILLFLLTSMVAGLCYGQGGPVTPKPVSFTVDSVAELLVVMALTNPSVKAIENAAITTEYEYRRAKSNILNNIIVSGNLNEFSLDQSLGSNTIKQSTQYPRYNIGVVIPVGLFVNNSKQTKAAYYRLETAYNQVDMQKQEIRREVLINYENYLMYKSLLTLQEDILQDATTIYRKQEAKFTKGELTIEQYVTASKAYNNEVAKQINTTRDLHVAEAELEALIGMSMNEALTQINIRLNR